MQKQQSLLWRRFLNENKWANQFLPNAHVPIRSAAVRQKDKRTYPKKPVNPRFGWPGNLWVGR